MQTGQVEINMPKVLSAKVTANKEIITVHFPQKQESPACLCLECWFPFKLFSVVAKISWAEGSLLIVSTIFACRVPYKTVKLPICRACFYSHYGNRIKKGFIELNISNKVTKLRDICEAGK